jgi:hypothetical protein
MSAADTSATITTTAADAPHCAAAGPPTYAVHAFVTGTCMADEYGGCMKTYIAALEARNIRVLKCLTPAHYDRPYTAQHAQIKTFLRKAKAVVIVLGHEDFTAPDRYSVPSMHLGACLFNPQYQMAIVVDRAYSASRPNDVHAILRNPHALAAIAEGKVVIVPTMADTIKLLERFQLPVTPVHMSTSFGDDSTASADVIVPRV